MDACKEIDGPVYEEPTRFFRFVSRPSFPHLVFKWNPVKRQIDGKESLWLALLSISELCDKNVCPRGWFAYLT